MSPNGTYLDCAMAAKPVRADSPQGNLIDLKLDVL